MVHLLIAGERFTTTGMIWQANEWERRVSIDRTKLMRAWSWMSVAGGCCFSVGYGSELIELKPGMIAITVNKRYDVPDAIRSIIDAVRQGELDIQIENLAEKGAAELGLKGVAIPGDWPG